MHVVLAEGHLVPELWPYHSGRTEEDLYAWSSSVTSTPAGRSSSGAAWVRVSSTRRSFTDCSDLAVN